MKRTLGVWLIAALLMGCGTYQITYRFPSKEALAVPDVIHKHHAHGIGIGGGGYFFMVHQMFPALVDYTGEQKVASICPNGVYQVTHYTRFWHNAAAAFISWLVILNAYHPSEVEWTCARAPAPPPAPAPPEIDAMPSGPAPTPAPAPTP